MQWLLLFELIEHNATFAPEPKIFHNSMALLHVMLSHTELQWQKPTPPYLERVQQYIEANFARPLSNNQLARIAGRSTTGLARAFKREFGSAPAQHVTKVRIREACRLLAQSDCSIEEIAEQTGFPNRFYFSRVFKKVTFQTPAEYRRRCAENI